MAGRKLFTNTSQVGLDVSLKIRASWDPRNQAGSKDFFLDAGESRWEDYGDDINIYLNGIRLAAIAQGSMIAQQWVVVERGAPLDDQLNTRNAVDFAYANNAFSVTTRQVWG